MQTKIIENKYIDEDEVLREVLNSNINLFKDIFSKNKAHVEEYYLCRHLARSLFCKKNTRIIIDKFLNDNKVSLIDCQLLAMQGSIKKHKCDEIKKFIELRLRDGMSKESIVEIFYEKIVIEPKTLNLEGLSIYDIFFD